MTQEFDTVGILQGVDNLLADSQASRTVTVDTKMADLSILCAFILRHEGKKIWDEREQTGIRRDAILSRNDKRQVFLDKLYGRRLKDGENDCDDQVADVTLRDLRQIGEMLVESSEIYSDPYEAYLRFYDAFVKCGGQLETELRISVANLVPYIIPFKN